MFALEVEHLSKSFKGGLFKKDAHVLKDISFKVKEGTTTGFVGVNGSGKTTSLKCIMQFIFPDQGQILFYGKPLDQQSRQRIGYLPERPYLYEFLTGAEFLKLHWDLWGKSSLLTEFNTAMSEALERVNLTHAKDKKLRTYSKGMLQRIGIAQAILTKPDFIIFDEPMSGLDPDGRFLVKEILREEQSRGATIFFSSHLLQDMDELCSDLVVIEKGQIAYSGTLSNFKMGNTGLEAAFEAYRKGHLIP